MNDQDAGKEYAVISDQSVAGSLARIEALVYAIKLGGGADASHLVAEAKIIEAYILGVPVP